MRTHLIPVLAAALLMACGSKDDKQGDADTTIDTGDPAGDADVAPDPDIVEDTAEDPDVTPDPDVVEDTPFDPVDADAVDTTVEDTRPDPTDTTPDSPCSGIPFIRTSDKGTEYTTGGCNPDGSTTEDLVAADLGSCCISVDHYCAWLNCCSTLVSSLSPFTTPWTITIVESETGPFCYCEGWFSPSYEVCGLTPGTYTVRIGTLSFTVVVS